MSRRPIFPILSVVCLLMLAVPPVSGFCSDRDESSPALLITEPMQYEYARTLFRDRDFEAARIEFKRFLHFFPQSALAREAEFNLARCLFEQREFARAARAFNEVIRKDPDSDLAREACFYQSRAFLNTGNPGYAQIVLQNLLTLTDDPKTKDRAHAGLAQIHLETAKSARPGSLDQDLDSAEHHLKAIRPEQAESHDRDLYLEKIDRVRRAPRKDPRVAGLLSIVPGGGFLYCERYRDALVSFLLNTGLILAAHEAWDQDNRALAGVIGFVETGFYAGNIYGAMTSAHKFNQAQVLAVLNGDDLPAARLSSDGNSLSLLFDLHF